MRPENVGKKIVKKVRKNVFYIRTNIVPKTGGKKRAKQFFLKRTNSATKKCWEKKPSEKSAKKRYLYLHEYRDQKWGGKTRETIFPQTQE